MNNIFIDINMELIPASKADYIPHASNGFLRIDTMEVIVSLFGYRYITLGYRS